jgi:acyl-CoA synthetase (AMP-forming)/AMP-acid ligase II
MGLQAADLLKGIAMDLFHRLHGKTIPAWLHAQARVYGFRLAASLPSWRGHRDRLSYAQLVRRMDTLAAALHALGLAPGERVALLLPNRAAREGVLTALACWRLGALVAPLNCRSADPELLHAIALIEPAWMVVADAAGAQRLRDLGHGDVRVLRLDGAPGDADSWPEPEHCSGVAQLPAGPLSAQEASCLLFTSGTTAHAKAVLHTHASQLHAGAAVGGALGLTDDDTYQGAFPLYTSSALNLACMSAWVHGAGVVLEEEGLDNAQRLALIAAECTSVYHGVPAVLHYLVDTYAQGGHDLSCVRRIGYGGAPMPVEVIAKFSRHWPHVDQVHIWGMTETGPAGVALPPWMLPLKAGAIGLPQPGCSIRVLAEGGKGVALRDAAQGEIGEIAFAGPSAASGYFRQPQATAETFVDGWVLTGDLGQFDAQGVLHYVDRRKDVINRGGLKIASAAVEAVIHRWPEVAEVAVVAVPHDKLGEDVAACIMVRAGQVLDWSALRAACRAELAEHALPRRWFAVQAMPRNAMGKLLKNELRAQLQQGLWPEIPLP